MPLRYGAEQSDWAHLTLLLGLEQDLLPVVSNPNAEISSTSALKRLGQIPSLYTRDNKVIGIARWTEYKANGQDIAKWSLNSDYGICLQTRNIRALDCDITHEALAAEIFQFINAFNYNFPVRGRPNASKFLMPFRLPGAFAKRVLHLPNGNPTDKIEFLATGQQFIFAGTHPSGVKYQWRGGLPYKIPALTEHQFEELWSSLKTKFNATETKDSNLERAPPGGDVNDPEKLDFLEKTGIVLGYSTEGSAYITCPFKSGHSKEGDKTETIYFPKGLRGYETGHFKCMHASCASRTDDDFLEALNYTASKFESLPPLPPEEQPTPRFTFVQAAEYANQPPPDWIIEDVLPKAELAVTFGESGAGKSFVALDVAFSVARGVDWNGKKVKQGRVAYVCAEGSGGVRARLKAYQKHYNISNREFENIPLTLLADTPSLLDIKDITALGLAINAQGPTVMTYVDTLAQSMAGGEENSGEDMGRIISHCRRLHKITGALTHLVHHSGKDLAKGARGHTSLRGAADAMWEASREGKCRNLRIYKQKDGEDGMAWGISLTPIQVEWSDHDKLISSCVVEYSAVQKVENKKNALKKNEILVLQALEDAGGMAIPVPELAGVVALLLPWSGEGRDRRKDLATQAIKSLVDKEVLVVNNNVVGYLSPS
jgi:AAA domain